MSNTKFGSEANPFTGVKSILNSTQISESLLRLVVTSGHVHTSANKTLRLRERDVQGWIGGLSHNYLHNLPPHTHTDTHVYSSKREPRWSFSIKCPEHVRAQIRHTNKTYHTILGDRPSCTTSHTQSFNPMSTRRRHMMYNSYRLDKVAPPGTQEWRDTIPKGPE